MIGTYAMVGSIVLTFGACLPIISDVFKGEPYTLDQLIWLAVFTPLLVVVWIYPYVKLRALVKRIKQQRMHFFKNQISQAFTEWFQAEHNIRREQKRNLHMAEDFATAFNKRVKMREMIKPQIDQVSTFHGFFKEIDRSPESFFDFYSVLELAKIMGIPSVFALLSYLFNF